MTPLSAPRLLLLLAALGVPGALPAAASAEEPTAHREQAFKTTDRNADGVVDHAEFHQRTVDVFYFLDVDKDGTLSFEEVKVERARFDAADTNHDGKLQIEEFEHARAKDFEAADSNGDGVLTPAEVQAAP